MNNKFSFDSPQITSEMCSLIYFYIKGPLCRYFWAKEADSVSLIRPHWICLTQSINRTGNLDADLRTMLLLKVRNNHQTADLDENET